MSWQLQRLDRLLARSRRETAVTALWVRGSGATPESLDGWSDLDVSLTIAGSLDLEPVISELGDIWALETACGDDEWSCRVVLDDGNRLDLRILRAPRSEELPATLLFRRDQPTRGHTPQVVMPRPACAAVNRVRFVAAIAVVKLGRGDQLIGTHLALDVPRQVLEQGMALRDRDEQRTHHRHGTRRDDIAGQVVAMLGSPAPVTDWLRAALELFERTHMDLHPTCPSRGWTALDALLTLAPKPRAPDGIAGPDDEPGPQSARR